MSGGRIDEVELNDANRARIRYLSRPTTEISEAEAERIVRFSKLPSDERTPSMLRMDEKPASNSTSASNGSPTDTPDNITPGVCAAIRRRMRTATRVAEVVDEYADEIHPSAVVRHAEGRCACRGVDADPTRSPRVSKSECRDMRLTFRAGATKRDVMSDFYRSAKAVNKHLFGRCPHHFEHDMSKSLSTVDCGHIREAFRRNQDASFADLAAAFLVSKSTIHLHLRDKCDHSTDVPPV